MTESGGAAAQAAQQAWSLPWALRIGPLTYQVHLYPQVLADEDDRPPLALPAGTLAIVQVAKDPKEQPALHYASWSAAGGQILGNKYSVEVDLVHQRLTWYWPVRSGRFRSALWELSVLATLQALALAAGGLLLHGAAVVLDGAAVVVTGPSGAGKSTLAKRFAGQYLHDDVIALVPSTASPTGWAVWSQDAWRAPGPDLAPSVPLRRLAIFSTDRSQTVATPLVVGQALAELAAQTYFAGGAATASLMTQLTDLAAAVPLCRFSHCLSDPADHVKQVLLGSM